MCMYHIWLMWWLNELIYLPLWEQCLSHSAPSRDVNCLVAVILVTLFVDVPAGFICDLFSSEITSLSQSLSINLQLKNSSQKHFQTPHLCFWQCLVNILFWCLREARDQAYGKPNQNILFMFLFLFNLQIQNQCWFFPVTFKHKKDYQILQTLLLFLPQSIAPVKVKQSS